MRALWAAALWSVGCAQIVGADFDDYTLETGAGGKGGGGGGIGGTGGAGGSPPLTVLVLESSAAEPFGDELKAFLDGTGEFGEVTFQNLASTAAAPTLSDLQAFDAVVFTARSGFNNRVALGDAFAAYVDGGGKLVLGRGVMCDTGNQTDFAVTMSADYLALSPGALDECVGTVTVNQTGDALIDGALSLTDIECCAAVLASGAQLHGEWSNSHPLVATKVVAGRLRVDINARPDDVAAGALFRNAILSVP